MPQQRTSAVRRVKPNIRGVQWATVDWLPAAYAGPLVRFAIFQSGVPYQDTTTDYSLQGIPAFLASPSGGHAISAVWNKPYLDITFEHEAPDTDGFSLRPSDPAFRGPDGQYLCSKFISGVIPPPPPVDAAIASGSADGTRAVFTLSDPAVILGTLNTGNAYNSTKGEPANGYIYAAGSLYVNFPTPPDIGDTIDFTGDAAAWVTNTGGTLPATSVTLT